MRLDSTPEELAAGLARVRQAPHLVLLLDYDGTIVPFTQTPELARPDQLLLQLLRGLAERPGTAVHVVSGRQREVLEAWLGLLPIGLHAEHGAWSRDAGAADWVLHPEVQAVPLQELAPLIERAAARMPGALVERKSVGLALHHRRVAAAVADAELERLVEEVRARFPGDGVFLLRGESVLEFRPVGVHKGLVVRQLESVAPDGTLLAAIGDDTTDEDMFAALPPSGLGIHVGPRPSLASLRLPDVAACRTLLRALLPSAS